MKRRANPSVKLQHFSAACFLNLSWFQQYLSCSKIKANNTKVTNVIHKWRTWFFRHLSLLIPKKNLPLETVKTHPYGISIDGINFKEINSVFSSNQIKFLPHQLTKPLLIMHDACDFVPRWIYIPDSMQHSGNCSGSVSYQTPKDCKALYIS